MVNVGPDEGEEKTEEIARVEAGPSRAEQRKHPGCHATGGEVPWKV